MVRKVRRRIGRGGTWGSRQTSAPASGHGHAATNGRNGATRAGPRDSGANPAATDADDIRRVLRRVHFSVHALEQFADRADIPFTSYCEIELLIRDLLLREGEVKTERPFWSQSSNTPTCTCKPASGCCSSLCERPGCRCHGRATRASRPSTDGRTAPGRTRYAAATSTRRREQQASSDGAFVAVQKGRESWLL